MRTTRPFHEHDKVRPRQSRADRISHFSMIYCETQRNGVRWICLFVGCSSIAQYNPNGLDHVIEL